MGCVRLLGLFFYEGTRHECVVTGLDVCLNLICLKKSVCNAELGFLYCHSIRILILYAKCLISLIAVSN